MKQFYHQLFLSLYDWSLMALWRKMVQPLLSQNGNQGPPIQRVAQYKIQKKMYPSLKKNIFGWSGEYIPWRIRIKMQATRMLLGQGISVGIIFFCLKFEFIIFYRGSCRSPTRRNHCYLKHQFPPKIPICPKSLLYKPEK